MISITYTENFFTITLKRIPKKNALNEQMYVKIIETFKKATESHTVKGVIMRGEGDIFCSGHDINEFVNTPEIFNSDHPLLQFLTYLESFPKILIFIVNGDAIGIGATMLFHGDYIIAHKKSRLQTPFVQMGLCAEAGSSQLAERIIGKPLARELLLFGRAIAVEKLEGRLISQLVSSTLQADALLKIIKKEINALPLTAIIKNKELMRYRAEDVKVTMEREVQAFSLLLNSPETQKIINKKLALMRDSNKK